VAMAFFISLFLSTNIGWRRQAMRVARNGRQSATASPHSRWVLQRA
jgi:hypothetical protein